MRKDPKSGEVFDYVEPIEPKTKSVIYKFVEDMGSDTKFLTMLVLLAMVFILSFTAYNITALVIKEGNHKVFETKRKD